MEFKLNNQIAKRSNKSVYAEDGKLIKLFVEGHPASYIFNEALNQSRVEEYTDLNVPKLQVVTKINNCWALVSDFAEGNSLESLMKQNPEKFDEYLNLFIKIQLDVLSKQVPLLNRIKDKFKRKLNDANIDENTRYELLHRLEGMKNHTKLCHGDYNPSNVIIKDNGEYTIIDWAHATQGNASADCARTYLWFVLQGKQDVAEQYLTEFSKISEINKNYIQEWIPIVAAEQLSNCNAEEQAVLVKLIDIADYQ